MPITKISPKHQITIPTEIFRQLEIDDYLEAKVAGGAIVLIPKKLIPKDQAWFWTKEWQDKEREAEEDIRTERIEGPFKSGRDEALPHEGFSKGLPTPSQRDPKTGGKTARTYLKIGSSVGQGFSPAEQQP